MALGKPVYQQEQSVEQYMIKAPVTEKPWLCVAEILVCQRKQSVGQYLIKEPVTEKLWLWEHWFTSTSKSRVWSSI